MKKRWNILAVCGVMAALLTGCSGEISNDYITIKQYKGLEVPKTEVVEVTDEDVENAIESYRNSNKVKQMIIGRAAQEGDTVNMDYVGKIDGEAFDGGTAEGATLVLGSGQYIQATADYPGFEDQIVGHNAGDVFDITVQFPAEYSNNPDMENQVAVFSITLNEVYTESMPEVTDEWVQTVSEESATVEEFEEEIRSSLEESNEMSRESTMQQNVLAALLEQVEVKEYPEGEVEARVEQIEEQQKSYASLYGMDFDEFRDTYLGMTEEDYNTRVQETAEIAVQQELALELIAEKEKLEPTEEEYEAKFEEYASQMGFESVDALKEAYDEDTLKTAAMQDAVLDYLTENCVETETDSSGEESTEAK